MTLLPGMETLPTAWQWMPSARNGRVVWVIEKTFRNHRGDFIVWRLVQDFTTREAAMNLVSEMNNSRDWSKLPIRRVSGAEGRPRSGRKDGAEKVVRAAVRAGKPVRTEPTADQLRAALAARDARWTFTGLWRGEERVPARLTSSMSGRFWRLREPIGGRWNVPSGPNSRIQRDLGLHEAEETAPGVVRTREGKAWVARAGCRWGTDALRLPAA